MARKAKYSAGRSKTVLCGTPLTPNAAIAVRYDKRLQKLIKSMVEETDSEIRSLYKTEPAIEHFAQDDTIGAQAKILMNKPKYNILFFIIFPLFSIHQLQLRYFRKLRIKFALRPYKSIP